MESTIIKEISGRIKRASNKIGKELNLPQRRCISDMLYGILGSTDTKLSSISRALQEEVALGYTIKRLSRNLKQMEITDSVNSYMSSQRLHHLESEEIIAIDGGDIRKNYAEKMEYLHRVYDGSEKQICNGYNLFCMATIGSESVRPLYGELYSAADPEYKSTYNVVTKALDMLKEKAKGRPRLTVVSDRGYDDEKLFRYYLKNDMRFITRLRQNRNFMIEGSTLERSVGDLYGFVKSKKIAGEVIHEGILKSSKIEVALLHGKVNHIDEELSVIVIKASLYPKPMYLLTNIPVENLKQAYKIYVKYLKRWGIELLYRVMKEKFNLEDIRVLKYRCLRNIFSLLMAGIYLISKIVYKVGNNTEQTFKNILNKAMRLKKTGHFLYYAIADGLEAIIRKISQRPPIFEKNYWQPPAYSLFYKFNNRKNG